MQWNLSDYYIIFIVCFAVNASQSMIIRHDDCAKRWLCADVQAKLVAAVNQQLQNYPKLFVMIMPEASGATVFIRTSVKKSPWWIVYCKERWLQQTCKRNEKKSYKVMHSGCKMTGHVIVCMSFGCGSKSKTNFTFNVKCNWCCWIRIMPVAHTHTSKLRKHFFSPISLCSLCDLECSC